MNVQMTLTYTSEKTKDVTTHYMVSADGEHWYEITRPMTAEELAAWVRPKNIVCMHTRFFALGDPYSPFKKVE